MPRDGAVILSDVRNPMLSIVCEPCGRRGTYNVVRLMERHGDAKMTDLLQTLAHCPKVRSVNIHNRCAAVFEGWPYDAKRGVRQAKNEVRIVPIEDRLGLAHPRHAASWRTCPSQLL